MEAVRLLNYRCFEDTGIIDFKPINFLVGANSSGKSSFIKIFPLFKQSIGIKRNGVFLWYGNDVDFKDFSNVVQKDKNTISVEFTIKDIAAEVSSTSISNSTISNTPIDAKIRIDIAKKDDNFDYLKSLHINYADQKLVMNFKSSDSTVKIVVNGNKDHNGLEKVYAFETNSLLPRFIFANESFGYNDSSVWCDNTMKQYVENVGFEQYKTVFRTYFIGSKEETIKYIRSKIKFESGKDVDYNIINDLYLLMHINNIIDCINIHIFKFANNISYVGPLRATTQRYYRFQNYELEDIDSDGKNLAMYLFNLDEPSQESFQDWTSKLFGFKVITKPADGSIELIIEEENSFPRNMVDVGFGYTQILPIIAIIWKTIHKATIQRKKQRKKEQFFIAIEQPELHLHPRLQGLFATMLIKVIDDAKKQNVDLRFVIETHSEIIINKIGEHIALNNVPTEDVNIFLFNAQKEGMSNYVEKSHFTNDGQLINWPIGFFSDYVY